MIESMRFNLNTSHVNVNLTSISSLYLVNSYLNTSHVNVNLLKSIKYKE